jgi:hypothetical protein
MTHPIIRFNHATFGFPGIVALEDISLTIPESEFCRRDRPQWIRENDPVSRRARLDGSAERNAPCPRLCLRRTPLSPSGTHRLSAAKRHDRQELSRDRAGSDYDGTIRRARPLPATVTKRSGHRPSGAGPGRHGSSQRIRLGGAFRWTAATGVHRAGAGAATPNSPVGRADDRIGPHRAA